MLSTGEKEEFLQTYQDLGSNPIFYSNLLSGKDFNMTMDSKFQNGDEEKYQSSRIFNSTSQYGKLSCLPPTAPTKKSSKPVNVSPFDAASLQKQQKVLDEATTRIQVR